MSEELVKYNDVVVKQSMPGRHPAHEWLLPVHTTIFPESVINESSSQPMETFLFFLTHFTEIFYRILLWLPQESMYGWLWTQAYWVGEGSKRS